MTSATRQRNPRGEGARLREPLVDAAVAVISEVGDVTKVSVRAITRAAGVSPTALYLHFPDRDAIVQAALDKGFDAFNAAILAGREEGAEPREQLRAMGHAYLAFAAREPHLYFVIFSAARSFDPDKSGTDRGAGFEALVELTARTLPDPSRALEVAIAMWAALHGYATLTQTVVPVDFPTPAAFADQLLDAYV